MFVGYIQHSGSEGGYSQQYELVTSYAKERGLCLGGVYDDERFENLEKYIDGKCQGIVLGSIVNFGRSLSAIKNRLIYCKNHNLEVFSATENYHFTPEFLTDELFMGMDIAANIRGDLISQGAKATLQQLKEQGVHLGRAKGTKIRKSLEGREKTIQSLLAQSVSKSEIARRLGVSRVTLYNFMKK